MECALGSTDGAASSGHAHLYERRLQNVESALNIWVLSKAKSGLSFDNVFVRFLRFVPGVAAALQPFALPTRGDGPGIRFLE